MRSWVSTLIFVSGALWGQAPTGQMTGTVTDPSGASVVGASVVLVNPATNIRRATVTNEDGLFNLPALPPGVYNLEIEAKGFAKQIREGIELQVGQVAKIDVALRMGTLRRRLR